jgi:lipoate-protein ligase A
MALDEALLEAMPRLKHPILRFYGWTQPAASFGYFQKYPEIQSLTALRPLVRRPTGGGLVPHDADWTYSLVFPTSHEWYLLAATESYRRIHLWIQTAFKQLDVETELAPAANKNVVGQCFIGHEQCDLLWRGGKIAGAAQRRRKDGLLIQGSIQPPPNSIARHDWEQAMREAASFVDAVTWKEYKLGQQVQEKAAELVATKYTQPSYTQRR